MILREFRYSAGLQAVQRRSHRLRPVDVSRPLSRSLPSRVDFAIIQDQMPLNPTTLFYSAAVLAALGVLTVHVRLPCNPGTALRAGVATIVGSD